MNSQNERNGSDLQVREDGSFYPELCPAPVPFQAAGCQDAVTVDVPAVILPSLGRIIRVDATVKNVCPGKRVAAAILLYEEDAQGNELPRGMKTILIPAHGGEGCRDITIRCVPFVVPEALDATGSEDSLCNARKFRVKVLANYTDTDFVCCEAGQATL